MNRFACAAVALLASACADTLVGPDPAADGEAMFEQVWRDLDLHYPFFTIKHVNWDSLHAVYGRKVAVATSPGQVADAIGGMLVALRDIHVNLFAYWTYAYRGSNDRPSFFNPYVVRNNYLTDPRDAPGRTLVYGRLGSDVGYIWIGDFDGSSFGPDVDAALAALTGVRALIVDVRANGGGSNRNALDAAARFVSGERTYAYVHLRNGPGHGDFTPWHAEVVTGVEHPFAGALAVLADRHSFSAAETFVLMLRAAPATIVVGDTTGGAAGNPITRELPNGWTYRFSQWAMVTPAGETFEEVGLPPDVWVQGRFSANDTDALLDTALAVVRRTLPAASPTGARPQPALAFATSWARRGRISNRSPTIP